MLLVRIGAGGILSAVPEPLRPARKPLWRDQDDRSRRALPLISLAVLRRHYERQVKERHPAGAAWEENDLVFPTRVGTPVAWNNFRQREFLPLLGKAGLDPLRPHDLRHSTGTLLMELKLPTAVVAAILGHSRPSTTSDIYHHVSDELAKSAAEALHQLFGLNPSAE